MSFIKYLLELEERGNTIPKVGDLITPPTDTTGFSKYGTVKRVTDQNVIVSLGGPSPVEYPLSAFTSPQPFQTDDPVWQGLNGKVTLWQIRKI